jgi:hypothetical protein
MKQSVSCLNTRLLNSLNYHAEQRHYQAKTLAQTCVTSVEACSKTASIRRARFCDEVRLRYQMLDAFADAKRVPYGDEFVAFAARK